MGSFPLLGIDRDAWDAKYGDDLIAIKPRSPPDLFSQWFTESLVPRYHHIFGKTLKVSLTQPSQTTLLLLIGNKGAFAR